MNKAAIVLKIKSILDSIILNVSTQKLYGLWITVQVFWMVKRKRGSGVDREELSQLLSKTNDKNKTVFEVLDEH